MDGLMMDFPLTLTHLLRRGESFFGDGEIVTRLPDKSFHRTSHGETLRRSRQLAVALQKIGLERGDRVATLCWNHYQHHEAYFGVPCGGFVLHTLNLRLHPNDLELHREPRRRPRGDRRPCAPAAARAVPGRDADRARLRGRGLVRGAARDRRSATSGKTLSSTRTRPQRCVTRAARPGGRAASSTRTARLSCMRSVSARTTRSGSASRHRRRRDAGRPDVPRERVGLSVSRDDAGREARLPRPASRPRQPAREHGGRAACRGRRACRPSGWGSSQRLDAEPGRWDLSRDEGDARRRLGGAARDDRGLRGAARLAHLPGLGNDRDVAGRVHGRAAARPRRRRTRRRAGTTRRWSASRFRSSRFARAPATRRCRGTASRWASSRSAGRGSRRATYDAPESDRPLDGGRLVPHRRHRLDPPARLHPDQGPLEGRDQVGRRVDLVGRARERADGASRGRGGRGDRDARRQVGRAAAGGGRAARGRRRRRPTSCASSSRRSSRSGGFPSASSSSPRSRRRASASSARSRSASSSRPSRASPARPDAIA